MKREEKTKLTRERIIAASIDEFGSKGYAMASVNNVCDAGIAKGLIYHNFNNKDDLYLTCIRACFDELTDFLKETSQEYDFDAYLKARLSYFERNKSKANMILEALISPPEQHRDSIADIRKPYDEINLKVFDRILSERHLRDGVNKESAAEYFLMVQNMFNWYFASPAMSDKTFENVKRIHEDVLPKMIDYLLYGIIMEDK